MTPREKQLTLILFQKSLFFFFVYGSSIMEGVTGEVVVYVCEGALKK